MTNLEQSDFEESGSKGFRRLTQTQSVGLKYGDLVLSVKNVVKENGNIKHVEVTASPSDKSEKVN